MKILMLLLISLPAFSSNIYFADSCSREEVKVATPNGTILSLNLDNLDTRSSVRVRIIFRPSGIIEDLKPSQQKEYNYYFAPKRISSNGKLALNLSIPPVKWMHQVEGKFSNYRVWDAEVIWSQNNIAKSAVTSFFRPEKKQSYYEIKSESLCSWEGRPQIDSELYENRIDEMMVVTRLSKHPWFDSNERGISFGHTNGSFENVPVGALNNNYGWIFNEWKTQFENYKNISISRDYVLAKDEAGFFVIRPSYNRHKVIKYSWSNLASRCGSYEAVSEGYLDIGKSSEDFMVIPSHYYGRENILDYLEIVRPAINTCKSFPINNAVDAEDIISSGLGEMLYFYELGSL